MITLARRPPRRPTFEQQALQGLHRIRSLWMSARTARINALRGFCREFGLAVPQWARTGIEAISHVLADPISPVPLLVRHSMKLIVEEIRLLEQRIAELEKELRVAPTRLTPITFPAASCLPFAAIGAPRADSMSAPTTASPLTMPDIRLHALPLPPQKSISSLASRESPYRPG
jgi:hypothetical protein